MGAPACTLVKLEAGIIALLIIGYIAINITADLPRFLIAENIALAIAYTATLALILKGSRAAQPTALLVSAFNAGRVSRSIITPEGQIADLAKEHTPLLATILLVSIIALTILTTGRCNQP